MPHLHFLILCPSAFVFFFTNWLFFFPEAFSVFVLKMTSFLPLQADPLRPRGGVFDSLLCNYGPLSPSHLKLHAGSMSLTLILLILFLVIVLKICNFYVYSHYVLVHGIVCLDLFQSHIAVKEKTNLKNKKNDLHFQKITTVWTHPGILYYYYFPQYNNMKVMKTMNNRNKK